MSYRGLIGLDFETYGAVDLRTHGLNRYMEDETFTPLIARTHEDSAAPGAFDFVTMDRDQQLEQLENKLTGRVIAAHNAPFEKLCLEKLGIRIDYGNILDSAVVARAVGAGSKLEVAAPQLLNVKKLEMGKHLIKLFSIPGKLQQANGSLEFDPDIVKLYPQDWRDFGIYCGVDARLGYEIVRDWGYLVPTLENRFAELTMKMNEFGWYVDMKDVHEMQERYEDNKEDQLDWFRSAYEKDLAPDARPLNFNSFPQLQKWCADRGVKAKSFDEEHVEKMISVIDARIVKGGLSVDKLDALYEVLDLLQTKQVLGGSSLKKLETIGRQRSLHDDRLRDQYLHIGAGQTWRTSGRGVQMQNLKRLTNQRDMAELHDDSIKWNNQDLASNLRQVFRAEHPQGKLYVGDFSSVESRGLAYLAGAEWKLQAYRDGDDLYKRLASSMFNVPYDHVDKQQRQVGKVGELSCGYGAGGGAVQSFASGMGVKLTELEAKTLVTDWRDVNPEVLALWDKLDSGLKIVVEGMGKVSFHNYIIGNNLMVEFEIIQTPQSLLDQVGAGKVQSIAMVLYDESRELILKRFFHGCHMRGGNVGYFKPTDLLSGDLWKNHYRDPKTKEIKFYSLYGGKLAGLLTQSLCRQLFFESLDRLDRSLKDMPNVRIIGQFHDEIVVEWQPDVFEGAEPWAVCWGEDSVRTAMQSSMTQCRLSGFPLDAEIKNDWRYTK